MSDDSHHEIELKRLLIGEDAADRLVSALGPVASDLEQVNHVFDTPDLRLHQSRYSFRLREEGGTFILTAKGPSRELSSNISTRTEAETEVEKPDADLMLSGRRDLIAALRERVTGEAFAGLWQGLDQARAGQPLREIGSFNNRRRTVKVVVPPDVELHVEVDQTRFPNGNVDDEVEIELPSPELAAAVEAWLADVTAAAGIDTKPSSPKLARFYAAREKVTP
jgi:hypothetical protein